jgi:hypothetical protein
VCGHSPLSNVMKWAVSMAIIRTSLSNPL